MAGISAPLGFAEEGHIAFPKIAKAKQTSAWRGLGRSACSCLPTAKASASFPAIAQAPPLPLLQPTRFRLASAGRSGLADAGRGGATGFEALK